MIKVNGNQWFVVISENAFQGSFAGRSQNVIDLVDRRIALSHERQVNGRHVDRRHPH